MKKTPEGMFPLQSRHAGVKKSVTLLWSREFYCMMQSALDFARSHALDDEASPAHSELSRWTNTSAAPGVVHVSNAVAS